ncbi:MAG: OmpA family protein [Myxococcales bacterium]|jgi:outer membrane protein OmpA-like peptidoglycan-associated protein|nr:OmpA family protein [Myxococcales bacterium]
MKRFTTMKALFLALVFLINGNALAAGGEGFAINRFDPSERGSIWLSQESLDFRGDFRVMGGLVVDYAKRPLGIYDLNDELVDELLAHQLYGHLGASFVFLNRFRLSFNLPVVLYQEGKDVAINGAQFAEPDMLAIGDLRLTADVRLVGEYGDAFTMALGVQVFVPTGNPDQYTGDGKLRAHPRIMVAGEAGHFVYAARVGFHYRADDDTGMGGDFKLGSEVSFGLALGLQFLDRALLIGPEFNGSTVVTQGGDETFDKYTSPTEVLLGVRYAFDSGVTLAAGGGFGLWRALGSPQARGVFSIGYSMPYVPPVYDRDQDGIVDPEDACPDVPGVVHTDPAKNGCPSDIDSDGIIDAQDACPDVPGVAHDDPAKNGCPPDRDNDGIVDAQDACPDVPGVAHDDPAKNGCPPDRDNDGIYDADDACPIVAGVTNADLTKHGCPPDRDGDGIIDAEDACPEVVGRPSKNPERNGCPPDRDNDGIYDDVDACPFVPGVANDDPLKNGCPDNPDRDGDKIPNEKDACPDIPGKASKNPERNGCPPVFVKGGQIVIQEQIRFVTGSAKIAKSKLNDDTLKAVKEILEQNPRIKLVRVEGHTDNVGKPTFNQKLSGDRAKAVADWLIKAGIDGSRLSNEGFGQDRPLAPNKTSKGRAANRRVEFNIAQVEEEVW